MPAIVILNIYNSAINKTSTHVTSAFNFSADTNNQFSWNEPSNYPFTREAGAVSGYGQDLDWVNLHKDVIQPFSGISAPPNPGLNFSAYSDYETGLFGYDRATYRS